MPTSFTPGSNACSSYTPATLRLGHGGCAPALPAPNDHTPAKRRSARAVGRGMGTPEKDRPRTNAETQKSQAGRSAGAPDQDREGTGPAHGTHRKGKVFIAER